MNIKLKAADAIRDLISIDTYKVNFKENIKLYFTQVIDNITEIDTPFFMDLIIEIFESFPNIDLDAIKICEKCRNRILMEIKKFDIIGLSDENSSSFINKSFKIMKILTEKDQNIINQIPQIEVILEPVFEYMKNPSKIDFDEEIIYTISCFVRITKSIVPCAQKLFINLDKYFNQSHSVSEELYELLSYFILYGKDFLSKDQNYLNFVINPFYLVFIHLPILLKRIQLL